MLNEASAESMLRSPGLSALPDELLARVLDKALPAPGVLITRSSLDARRQHVMCCDLHGKPHTYQADHALEACTAQWRRGAACADLPPAVLDTPPWSRGKEADELYSTAGRPWLLVCKRWRDVALSAPVMVALCGVGDRPPPTTEALILCWDWTGSSSARSQRRQLHHLTGLPLLRSLAIWNPQQAYSLSLSGASYPVLPAPLASLRHLLVIAEPCYRISFAFSMPSRASFAALSELRTLVLPRSHGSGHECVSRILPSLPHLETLAARGCELDVAAASGLTSLRHLTAIYRAEMIQSPSAASSLESLTLLPSGTDVVAWSVLSQLASLSVLTRLELEDVFVEQASMDLLAHMPALVALRVAVRLEETERPLPLEGLSQLTALKFQTVVGPAVSPEEVCFTGVHLQQLKCMTALRDLDLSVHGNGPCHLLTALPLLTALDLTVRCELMTAQACSAVACVTGLQRLLLSIPAFEDDDAICALQPLGSLRDLRIRVPSAKAPWDALQPTAAFPHLERLHLSAMPGAAGAGWHSQITTRTLPNLSQMRGLHEVCFEGVYVSDEVVQSLGALEELRLLMLHNTRGWHERALEGLLTCEKLCVVEASGVPITDFVSGLPFTVLARRRRS